MLGLNTNLIKKNILVFIQFFVEKYNIKKQTN